MFCIKILVLYHVIACFNESDSSGGATGGGGGAAGARAPAVKPCAPAVPRQLSYSDDDHKRISWLRATDYFEDVNYDVINHAK